MERAFGMDIPRTLEEACDPRRMVLLVYDMQVGIASQLPHSPEVTARVGEVLSAAREGGFRVFFSRHTSLPKELMGASQLRQAMAWQRVNKVEEVVSPFPLRPLKPRSCQSSPHCRATRSPTRSP